MKCWIAFWNILVKDMRTYYLKPPNISWGLIFPLAWTGMFFIKSGSGLGSIATLLPGVVAVSILFGTTSGAIFFGVVNAFVPIVMAAFLIDLSQVAWSAFLPAVFLIAVASSFLGLFIAVAVSEVFEAQTFSNFFRFPMIFLCGLFFPVEKLPVFLKPLSYVLPLTYGADILHGAFNADNTMVFALDFCALGAFCILLFAWSLYNIKRRWIL
jgi:ABC-2 type transport system permease protein